MNKKSGSTVCKVTKIWEEGEFYFFKQKDLCDFMGWDYYQFKNRKYSEKLSNNLIHNGFMFKGCKVEFITIN